MTTSQPPQGHPPYSFAPQQRAAPKNGLGTTALVLGIIGLLFSFIPFIGVVAWPLVILGLIFGLVGFVRARSGKATNGGVAIAGTVLSAIGLIICIIYASAFSSAASDLPAAPASPAAGQPAQAPAGSGSAGSGDGDLVVYEVTGDGEATNVTYSKQGGQEQASNVDLPFRKEVRFDGGAFSINPLTIVAQNGGSGEITCKITKNGQEVTSSTSSGQFSVVTCNGT